MRHKLFQIGVMGVLFVTFIFFIVYRGQGWLDLFYYFVMPFSFACMIKGYPYQNSLTRIGFNAALAMCFYSFAKLVGIFEYDYEGTKILVPSVILLSIIYQIYKDYRDGNLNIK